MADEKGIWAKEEFDPKRSPDNVKGDYRSLKQTYDSMAADMEILTDRLKTLESALHMAFEDCKAFINQCDRDGIGMQTVTDHRKRTEKFLKTLSSIVGGK